MVTNSEKRVEAHFRKKCLEIVQHLDGYTMEEIDHILNAVRTVSSTLATVECRSVNFEMLWNDMLARMNTGE